MAGNIYTQYGNIVCNNGPSKSVDSQVGCVKLIVSPPKLIIHCTLVDISDVVV